jgi:hypothetical protein
MGHLTPTPASLLWLPVAALVFLLPGWSLARRLGSSTTLLCSFLGSAVILFNLSLLLDALRLPLHEGTTGLGLTLAALIFWRIPQQASTPESMSLRPQKWEWLWLVAPALAVISIAARSAIDPLSGYDNVFRWDYLARLVLAHRSLAGYPPVSAGDFEFYAWCDGIPPLAALLNFWIYATTGSIAPSLTALRVIAETGFLGFTVYRYSTLLWGHRAGRASIASFSASALALWSVAMGQETGLTALSLVAMLYFLELNAREQRGHAVFWAALAASVGALSRDYALVFPILGAFILLSRRTTRRQTFRFAGVATCAVAPWYIRNAVITGNPLYPHTIRGLFRGNPAHDEVMRYIADYWSPATSPFDPSFIAVFLAALTGILVLTGVTGMVIARRKGIPLALGILLMVALWAYSLPQTGGGWVYSSRVLLPALALLAVLGGWISLASRRIQIAGFVLLTIGAVDASRRSWLLPEFPVVSPLDSPAARWRQTRRGVAAISSDRVWPILVKEAAGSGIVVDHPANHALLTMQGGTAVPLFSPLLSTTFDDALSFDTVLSKLQRADIRLIVIAPASPVTGKLVRAHRFWATLCGHYQPNAKVGLLSIYDLRQLGAATP